MRKRYLLLTILLIIPVGVYYGLAHDNLIQINKPSPCNEALQITQQVTSKPQVGIQVWGDKARTELYGTTNSTGYTTMQNCQVETVYFSVAGHDYTAQLYPRQLTIVMVAYP